MKKAQGRKTVAFSDVIYVVESSRDKEISYTHEETARMQLDALREVLRLSRLLSTYPESFTKDHHLQCVGIESYVIPAIAEKARQERMNHARLILWAQRVFTDKGLSILSKKSSLSACQRAYIFANSVIMSECWVIICSTSLRLLIPDQSEAYDV